MSRWLEALSPVLPQAGVRQHRGRMSYGNRTDTSPVRSGKVLQPSQIYWPPT